MRQMPQPRLNRQHRTDHRDSLVRAFQSLTFGVVNPIERLALNRVPQQLLPHRRALRVTIDHDDNGVTLLGVTAAHIVWQQLGESPHNPGVTVARLPARTTVQVEPTL